MQSSEIIKKVRKIQLKVAKLSSDIISGSYTSAFKGSGIEFNEVREYLPGDDIRTIDWNVTARSSAPFVKRYIEERELTMILMVDLSGSQYFGSTLLKSELTAEIAALFAFLAIKNNDKVGLLIFTDKCETYIPPSNGRGHVLRVIREILGHTSASKGTDITQALNFIDKVIYNKSIIFLISDFMDTGYEKALQRIRHRHDLVAVSISDPREFELPPLGLVEMEDNETGMKVLVDTSARRVRNKLRDSALRRHQYNIRLLKSNRVDVIELRTDQPYLPALQKFFHKRELRR